MTRKYAAGMYGGKFMPMHKGHLHCLEVAAELCDVVYLVLVVGGADEDRIHAEDRREFLSVESRSRQIEKAAALFDNVIPVVMDVSDCRDANGEEDWDMETPIMLSLTGHFTAVFGSEPGYKPYFNRAYPWAEYIIVDPERSDVPISATKIRKMKSEEEINRWIV